MTPLHHATDRIATVRTRDGAELRVHTRGPENAPLTVVLAHGWALPSDIWRPQVSRLTSDSDRVVRTVRFDQRGHGGSTRGTRPLGIDLLGEDLARVLDTHAPTGPVVLGGHSLGGMAVMALAGARPRLFEERVAGTLLVAASAGDLAPDRPGIPLRARVAARGGRAAMRLLSCLPNGVDRVRGLVPPHLGITRAAVRRTVFGPDADPTRVRECAELIRGTPTETITGLCEPLMRLDMTERLGALRDVPVTIIAGGRDRMVPPRHARTLSRALPGALLRILPQHGHMLTLEAPEVVTEHLAELCRVAAPDGGGL
ncbi:alpha/beta fold hydrolase [Allosalinactinospora lopnorensis]|uniref:alpha/beta fold hydrolase n=1 Tax=Allosalinactinospora lopnorensis TaxID=1352348 RepID=UPI000623F565|nr:alpha/beta hydrolase [Allosalinactinospora lopnorensis]